MFTADLLERSVKTFIQTFIATFSLSFLAPANITDWGAWKAAGVAAILASVSAAVSAVMSVMSKPVGDKDTASIVTIPTPAPTPRLPLTEFPMGSFSPEPLA